LGRMKHFITIMENGSKEEQTPVVRTTF